jgi:hypothetical protein
MLVAAVALWTLSLLGPPALPPDIGELPPAQDAEPPAPAPEPPAPEPEPPSADVGSDATSEQAPEPDVETPDEPGEDEPIEVTPEPQPEPEPEPPVADAPAVQKPGAAQPTTPASEPVPPPVEGPTSPAAADTSPSEPEPEPEPETEQPEESYKKLGGFRLFRIGVAAKIGYTNGTSAKNGLYDRDKSIQDSIDNMMVTTSGAGDLGKTRFGGFSYGFILDAEVVGINVWLDFHKFFQPGGMWSLLLGYDHEFGFGKRLRLDVGVAGGLNHVFLGSVLKDLYYDKSNPEAVNIGTLGAEGRGMVDLHIKLVGPLYTGPYAMIGYHYLWSANVEEVTAEKGLHYSAGWSMRLDFAAPKLIGGRKKQPQE